MKFKFIIVFIYLLSNIFVFFLFNKINSDGIIIKYVKLDQFYGLFFDKSHQKFQSFPHLKLSFSKPIDKKDNSIHTDEANIKKYFRYGANYNFDLKKYYGTVTCIDTNKVFLLTISASEK